MQFFGFSWKKVFRLQRTWPCFWWSAPRTPRPALASEMGGGLMEAYGGHGGGNRGVGIGAGSIILKEAIRRSQHSEHTVVNRL